MQTNHVRVLEGPNVWSKRRVLEVELSQNSNDSDQLGSEIELLVVRWREMDSTFARSDFADCAWPVPPIDDADLLRVLILNLQRRVNLPVCESDVKRDARDPGIARIAVEIAEKDVGYHAWTLAFDFWNAIRKREPFDLVAHIERFKELVFEVCLGQTTGPIVAAAEARGIPVLRLDDVSLVQLGHGSRQRRLQTAVSDRSGYIAESISRDKSLTKSLLKRIGVPVPDGRLVVDIDDAWSAACEIGLPVVVKPCDADYGQGVSLKVISRTGIADAYRAARKYSESVIVERFLEGDHHRLLIVGSELIAAVKFGRVVAVGDGKRTVAQLIEEMNRDPRRGARDDRNCPWFQIELDDETRRVLAMQDVRLEDIPCAGARVTLRLEPRIGWGGGVFDVTDDVHPALAATVIDAVSMVGLDIAGVDVIAEDICLPFEEQDGAILEVNAGPAILMHLRPFSDPPRPVPESIVSLLFPSPEQSRIPIIGLCGTSDQDDISRRLVEILKIQHSNVGRATRAGVFVNDRCLIQGPGDGIQFSRDLLLHPKIDAAVFEVSLDKICREGLAFDKCDVALVLGIETTSIGNNRSRDDRLAALRVVTDSAQPSGTIVGNIDDPEIADIVLSHGSRVIAISTQAWNPRLQIVRENGGRGIYLQGDTVVLVEGYHEIPLFSLDGLYGNRAADRCSTLETLGVIATGWALGIPPERFCNQVPKLPSTRVKKEAKQIA